MAALDVLKILAPKKKPRAGGNTNTPTFNPQQAQQVLTVPVYRDHLNDLFTDRQAQTSQDLLASLFKNDTDVSSAVNGYLTLANTPMVAWMEDINGQVDPVASKQLAQLITRLSYQTDYTLGFQLKQNFSRLNEEFRYMLLLRGGIGADVVFDKSQAPDSVRNVDLKSIRWYEKQPGQYKPGQIVPGQTDPVMLDIPSFFVAFYRRDPTAIYTTSPFVSAINTIAARQQVINDLYRIMRFVGYPRIEIKVLEEVLRKNAPAEEQADATKMATWVANQMATIGSNFSTIAADQALVHSDSLEFKILNEKAPGMALNVEPIIATLNAQNQAGLKTMSTILGRGASGVNTGSVEARLAAMFADELNFPLVDLWQRLFSFIFHQQGYQGFARVRFPAAELRPETELEPQLALKASRLRQDLSDGLITDVEYHLMMYNRLPPDSAPELSGTGFMTPAPAGGVEPEDVSANTDSLGRSAAPERTAATRRNAPKSAGPRKAA